MHDRALALEFANRIIGIRDGESSDTPSAGMTPEDLDDFFGRRYDNSVMPRREPSPLGRTASGFLLVGLFASFLQHRDILSDPGKNSGYC